MNYNTMNFISIFIALVIIIILAIAKSFDKKNTKKYQEGIFFTFTFGIFVLMIIGSRYLSKDEGWVSLWPTFIASLIGASIIFFISLLVDRE